MTKPDARHALVLTLAPMLDAGEADHRWYFSNAMPLPGLSASQLSRLVCEQPFRPDTLDLQMAGYAVPGQMPEENGTFEGCVLLAGRSRKWNEAQIARLWGRLAAGGWLVVAGAKRDGIATLRKWVGGHGLDVESWSKYHCVVFRVRKTDATAISGPALERIVDGYRMAEGMFSASGPDTASKLLSEQFDGRIRGKVADLGAGWGFLSCEVLRRSDRVGELTLYEANRDALDYARLNLEQVGDAAQGVRLAFHWCDIAREFSKTPYDWVIMNPPFHTGRAARPELGQRFIEVAASTLVSGGRLLMVANRTLPYEATLDRVFRRVERRAERDGFKVLEAVK